MCDHKTKGSLHMHACAPLNGVATHALLCVARVACVACARCGVHVRHTDNLTAAGWYLVPVRPCGAGRCVGKKGTVLMDWTEDADKYACTRHPAKTLSTRQLVPCFRACPDPLSNTIHRDSASV